MAVTLNANVAASSFAKPSDEQLTEWRDEWVKENAERTAWAEKQVIGAIVEPITGLTISNLLAQGTYEDGQPMLIINPNGKGGTIGAHNGAAITSAFMSAFAYRDYAVLEIGKHVRRFNKASANEQDVWTERFEDPSGQTGYELRYKRFNWIGGRLINNTPNPATSEGKNWLAKHQELDLLLMALKADQVIHVVFFQPWQFDKFARRILGRLDKTVSVAKQELSADAEQSQQARKFRTAATQPFAKVHWNGEPIVVDDIDLSKEAKPVTIRVKTVLSGDGYDVLVDPKEAKDLEMVFANLGRPSVEMHIKK